MFIIGVQQLYGGLTPHHCNSTNKYSNSDFIKNNNLPVRWLNQLVYFNYTSSALHTDNFTSSYVVLNVY